MEHLYNNNVCRLTRMISGFHHEVDEICALLGNYAAYSGNLLPAFQDSLSGRTLWFKYPIRRILDS